MEVPVPVWKLTECRKQFTQNIFDTNLCAGGYKGGTDSCQVRQQCLLRQNKIFMSAQYFKG